MMRRGRRNSAHALVLQPPSIPTGPARDRDRCRGPATSAHAAGLAPGELPSLLQQRERMPAEFREHLFGNPLTVRVELDGQYLGDAEVLLHEDNRVQVIGFGDSHESRLAQTERARWGEQLAEPMALGVCRQQCRGMAALHYSLSNSLLSVLTPAGAQKERRHIALPDAGSRGLIVRNSLAVHGGQEQQATVRYSAELRGSAGHWSTVGSYQYYAQPGSSEHYLSALYAQRELGDHFVRAGYFLPTFEGIVRQPRAPGTQNDTALGLMFGSSDVLLADTRSPSVSCLCHAASGEGVVEIYRDGNLLSTQAVKPGIQEIDTRRLPGGIYDVELRVVQDGREASRESASIHSPAAGRIPAAAGATAHSQGSSAGCWPAPEAPARAAPRPVPWSITCCIPVRWPGPPCSGSARGMRRVSTGRPVTASAPTNVYTSSDAGRGVDLQGLYRYRAGSVVANHARGWVEQRERVVADASSAPRWETRGGWQDTTAISITHRFGHRDTASLRVARSSGFTRGTGIDVSYGRRETVFGKHDVNWRVSAYDRPGARYTGYRRQRGIDLTVSVSLGSDRRSYSGSLAAAPAKPDAAAPM